MMKIAVDRIPDIGRAPGFHVVAHSAKGTRMAIACDHQVAAVKLTVQIDGVNHEQLLTRDEAGELGRAFVECACDG